MADAEARPAAWRLERNHRQVMFAEGPELIAFSETTSAALSAPHAHPAWTVLLPVDGGRVTLTTGHGTGVHRGGVLIAPQQQYRSATDGPHVALYLNAWMSSRADQSRPRVVGAAAARRLLDALDVDNGIDLNAAVAELGRLVGRIGPADARLAAVMNALPAAERLDALAVEVGVSASRLRALARDAIGVPLTQLRLWARLSRAIAWLPHAPTAGAAAMAGFADQPHLTRVARRFLGRTPGDLSLRSLELTHAGMALSRQPEPKPSKR
jgi:AraC-like DNA-binding protein